MLEKLENNQMKISATLFIVLIFFALNAVGQGKWIKAPFRPGEEVCYGSGKVEKGFVPPPEEVMNRLKSGSQPTCNIIVTYSGFPDSVKQAFEYAIGIWEQLLESDVPVYVTASWKKLTDGNTLASCGPANYYKNLGKMYFSDRYYAVAAAEKIAGTQLTGPSEPDITATFNKDVKWYFGTDGNCPSDKYDFVSTILHEMAHGLGFIGFFGVTGNTAGYDDPPAIFDQYLSNLSKQFLVDESVFDNPSAGLLKAVTNNALYFRSPASVFNNNGAIPRLYAPSSFKNGSSIYHLNESSYPGGTQNSLMTYAAGFGEATHNPGPIALGILADVGWKNMLIEHTPLKDIENVTEPLLVKANIRSDYKLDTNAVFVYFSKNNFATKDSVKLRLESEQDSYTARLPVQGVFGAINYYISAGDEKARVFTNPAGAPENYYSFSIGPDTIKPTVAHQQVEFILDKAPFMSITAFADDNLEVDSLWLECLINNQNPVYFSLKRDSANKYSAEIPIGQFGLIPTDSLKYRIAARDKSLNSNIGYLPWNGYFKVNIERTFGPVTKYSNDFNNPAPDFISDDFEVKTPAGFLDGALQSQHPYTSPGKNGEFFNFAAILRYPIILAENGAMNYDEIVLVEPGEEGSVFGTEDFYDYVVVEGSKDFAKTWLPLTDGYDSRKNLTWKTEYNNGVDASGNSQTLGTKEMYVRNNFNMVANGNFTAGDTIFIRYRLYSDPLSNGWGWAIDNLRIQSLVSAGNISLSPGDFRVYPNPTNGKISVQYNSQEVYNNVSLSLYDNFGKKVYSRFVPFIQRGGTETIDIASFPSGLYFMRMESEGTQLMARKIVKQ
jgi:hypothetical protein